MAFTQLVPVGNQNNPLQSTVVAWPDGAISLVLRIDCTSGNPAAPFQGFSQPFNDPALTISGSADFSFDGGTTWQPAGSATWLGSPTGTWGRNATMAPQLTLTPPSDRRPTHIRGQIVPSARITFGVSVQVM